MSLGESASALQWGRTLSSAEGLRRGKVVLEEGKRFNGAALFQVRKGRAGFYMDAGQLASMGPHSFKCGSW